MSEFPQPATFDARRRDWRIGPVVYQIFVDRFAPSDRMESKREHYLPPRRLRAWNELPERGTYDGELLNSTAEFDFWGGDLGGVLRHLDHIASLGTDLVYLNPIFEAATNHKYDTSDYRRVDPQFGTNEELRQLVDTLHSRGMRLMLDGVFNHMGRRAPIFQDALTNPASPSRDWFRFGPDYRHGFLGWRNVGNLPELNLENPAVRHELWEGPNSVVRHYLRDIGIDGWRLDVAPDLGFDYLGALTAAAHETRPDAAVIGECWNYPEAWLRVLDGVLNMHFRNIILHLVNGRFSPAAAGRAIERCIADSGIEGILRSHLVLDNHDTPRLGFLVPDEEGRSLARLLQFTLPGAPTVYYGSEVDPTGGHDPANRAPMRWDLVTDDNPVLAETRRLARLRRDLPALRLGDFRLLEADGLLAFLRLTDDPMDTVVVVVNPTATEVESLVPIRDSRLMDSGEVVCQLSGERATIGCGCLEARLPARAARVYAIATRERPRGYDLYKRIRLSRDSSPR
jgi:glycosidase